MTKNNPNKRIVKGVCEKCNHHKLWTKDLPNKSIEGLEPVKKMMTLTCSRCGNVQRELR